MKQPANMAEYARMVEEASIEVDEMRASIEYGTEGDASQAAFPDRVEADPKRLKEALASGDHAFGGHDIGYVSGTDRPRFERFPFRDLLDLVNHPHRYRLAPGD